MNTGATLTIAVADIGELPAEQYVGLIDDNAVTCLVVRLATEGLLTPVWLRRNGNAAKSPWSIIAGRHRLRAALKLGWDTISAVERAGPASQTDELQRLQLAENLDRRTLPAIERALGIMCRWRSIVDAKAWDIVSHAREADVETAVACGVDDRTIRRYRRIFEKVISPFPTLFGPLNAHPLGKSLSAMNRLATLQVDEVRRRAIEMVLSRSDWKSIDEALVAAGLSDSRGFRVDQSRPDVVLLDAWHALQPAGRRAHVEWLAEKVTPSLAMAMIARFKTRGLLS